MACNGGGNSLKPFVFNVTSPTQPGYIAAGGTITTTDNGDGTWTLESNDAITQFKFDTNKADITTVECISATDLTNGEDMFSFCSNLTSVDTSGLTSVTNGRSMFFYCSNLTSIDTSGLTNVTNGAYMFYLCSSLTSVDTSGLTNVTNGAYMFYHCSSLTSIDTSGLTNVTNGDHMFWYCTSLTSLDTSYLTSVTNGSYMFYHSNIECITALDTTAMIDKTEMFGYCLYLTAPNATERADLVDANGAVYVNPNPCP